MENLIIWPDNNPTKIGRLRKCLSREYRFEDLGVMSLGLFLQKRPPETKGTYTREYANIKRNGCYAKLAKPKTTYSVWWGKSGMDVPKIVWDALNIPERIKS